MATGLANRSDQDSDVDPLANLADLEAQLDAKYGNQFQALDKKKAADPESVKNAEEAGATPEASSAHENGQERSGRDGSGWDTNLAKGSGRSKWRTNVFNRKNALRGTAVSLLVGGGLGAFSVIQGPLQIIHFAKVLDGIHMSSNNDFSNNRSMRLLRYMRYPDRPEMRRLGIFMNRYADRVESRWKRAGYTPIYDGPSGRLSGFRVDPNIDLTAFQADGINPTTNPDGTRTISFDEMFTSGRKGKRSFNRIATAGNYNNRLSRGIARGVLGTRAGVSFKLFSNERRRANESIEAYYERVNKKIAETFKNGARAPDARAQGEDGADEDTDPDPDPEADGANGAVNGSREEVRNGGSDGLDRGSARMRNDLDKGGGVLDLLCLAKGIANNYPKIQYSNVVLPLLRTGSGVMSIGSQVMTGDDLAVGEVGAVVTRLNTDKDGSWAAARSIQAELGKEQTGPDILPSAKPSRIGNNTALNLIDNVSGRIPGFGTACNVNNSAIGGVVLSALGGGVAGVATDLIFQYGMQAAGIDIFGFLMRLVAGEEVDGYASGAVLGNFANYGARLSANDTALSMGGKRLSAAEELALDMDTQQMRKEEMRYASLGTKLFDIKNPDSVAGQLAFNASIPSTPSQTVTALASAPSKLLATISRPFTQGSIAYAQEPNGGYDYGFEAFGFSDAEQNDPKNEPYAIATELKGIIDARTAAEDACRRRGGRDCEWTPSNLQEYSRLYAQCFGAEITQGYGPEQVEAFKSVRTVNYLTEPGQGGRPAECENGFEDKAGELQHGAAAAANDLRVIRFYLADTVIGHSMACYEGEESSCGLFGFGDGPAQNTSDGSGTNIVSGDTSNLTCEAGTDAGVADGYQDGKLYKIRICTVQGITVNAQIAKQLDSMINDARSVGVRLSGGGFRTMEGQVAARRRNGCPDIYSSPSSTCDTPTARPGYSNHQMGLSIDFNYSELGVALTTCQANPDRYPTYKWLAGNASRYGLSARISKECWHWSVTGR